MKKRAIESRVEQVYQIRPEHLNGAGRLFGGRLMEWIDEVAGLVGIRHSQCNVITASVDNLKFIRGVFQNDLVVLVGTLTWVGSTSMEVRVDTYVEKLNGTRYPVNRAYLTLVAVDDRKTDQSSGTFDRIHRTAGGMGSRAKEKRTSRPAK